MTGIATCHLDALDHLQQVYTGLTHRRDAEGAKSFQDGEIEQCFGSDATLSKLAKNRMPSKSRWRIENDRHRYLSS
jgi:hypothetical protein